jgi:hypothetical protein
MGKNLHHLYIFGTTIIQEEMATGDLPREKGNWRAYFENHSESTKP